MFQSFENDWLTYIKSENTGCIFNVNYYLSQRRLIMNTTIKNIHNFNSLYIQNPIEVFDGEASHINILLPFEEYISSDKTSLGVPMKMGTFYNDPTLQEVPEERHIKLDDLIVCLTELSNWCEISYRGLEFKIPLREFERLIIHKAVMKVLGDNRYESFVEILYDYNFSTTFLIEFSLNYD